MKSKTLLHCLTLFCVLAQTTYGEIRSVDNSPQTNDKRATVDRSSNVEIDRLKTKISELNKIEVSLDNELRELLLLVEEPTEDKYNQVKLDFYEKNFDKIVAKRELAKEVSNLAEIVEKQIFIENNIDEITIEKNTEISPDNTQSKQPQFARELDAKLVRFQIDSILQSIRSESITNKSE